MVRGGSHLERPHQRGARRRRRRYFNVTSDYLRETDHQWDYLGVPEAEGTRFFWDGTGLLPE